MGASMLRLAGLFVPVAHEMVEMMYEFTEPFVVDSRKIGRAFALTATPVEEGMRETVAWYRARG